MYVDSTTARSISRGSSFRRLWNGQNIQFAEKILVPFNPSGFHWILLVLDIKERSVTVLDPMVKNLKGNEVPVKSAIEVARSIFNKKFDVTDVTIKLDVLHITQQDGYNCGAFICYYANQIVKGIYRFIIHLFIN